jgi:hypothetical protein
MKRRKCNKFSNQVFFFVFFGVFFFLSSETPWLFPIFPKDNLDLFIFWWGSETHSTRRARDEEKKWTRIFRFFVFFVFFYLEEENRNAQSR